MLGVGRLCPGRPHMTWEAQGDYEYPFYRPGNRCLMRAVTEPESPSCPRLPPGAFPGERGVWDHVLGLSQMALPTAVPLHLLRLVTAFSGCLCEPACICLGLFSPSSSLICGSVSLSAWPGGDHPHLTSQPVFTWVKQQLLL